FVYYIEYFISRKSTINNYYSLVFMKMTFEQANNFSLRNVDNLHKYASLPYDNNVHIELRENTEEYRVLTCGINKHINKKWDKWMHVFFNEKKELFK
ncbi:MAG: hypothetical protein ABF654_13860, partial [Gluconobacter potus]|uniref:hypothetical protein n=1 Tax=Gluconobacter potus TaxID=2724927 RepID=UPI0039E7C1CA